MMFRPEWKVLFWMRTASYFKKKRIYFPIYLVAYLMHMYYMNRFGVEIPIGLKVGTPFHISHIPGIIINQDAIIGSNVHIWQNVTIGSSRGKGVPVIGDNVLIFSGAKIVGNCRVGNNVVIGANAVVTKDIPDNCVVGGIPAKVISEDSERILQHYLGNYRQQ